MPLAIRAFVTLLVVAGFSGCGGGGGGSGGGPTSPVMPPVNRAPLAANDIMRADGPALLTINVLANDSDPDTDPLTVTIEEAAPIGTASVNTDGTVRIESLPTGFKGVTRFKYRVKDPAGLSAVASAAIFVGADPFRVMFVGDAAGNGANEVYLTDLAAPAAAVTAATEGTLRLSGFVASENGATVAYRRADTSTPTTTDLSFVSTANSSQQVRISLPAGTTLLQDANGKDQYRVSADGQWIVAIARDAANADGAYVLNVASPTLVSKVNVADAVRVTLPRFSSDSKTLYLLASPSSGGSNKSLYATTLGSSASASLFSALSAPGTADDVLDYAVASDQTRILLRANRGGSEGLYFVDPTHLQTELQVNQPATGTLRESTISLPPGGGGSARGTRVAYTIESLPPAPTFSTYVAEVSATPNERLVASSGAHAVGFRPDDAALLYSQGPLIYEAVIDSGAAGLLIGSGFFANYDSTGNIVLLRQALSAGGSQSYLALAVTERGKFGTTLPLGTAVLAAQYVDVSGFDRAVTIIGEGPTSGPAATSARLALVNAAAPDKLIYLADFQSPLVLSSAATQVVGK